MNNTGVMFVVLAALFWGLSGGIGGVLIENGWSSLMVAFYRGAFGLLFVVCWLILQPRNRGFQNGRLWLWSVAAGLGVAGNFVFYFLSIAESSVAVAATLMYCAPVFVYLVSFTLKLEKSTPLKWGAIVLVMVGVVLLTRVYQVDASGITKLGVMAGLASGMSLALFIFGFKYATPYGSPQSILVIAFTVLVAVCAVFLNTQELVNVVGSSDLMLFLLLGLLGGGVSFILYIMGLRQTAPGVASIVAMVEPVTATLFGVLLLNEILSGVQLVGMGLILFTVTALSLITRNYR